MLYCRLTGSSSVCIRLTPTVAQNIQEEAMIWVPILLGTFKVAVFGTGMFFAIKSHRDRARQKEMELRQRQMVEDGPGARE